MWPCMVWDLDCGGGEISAGQTLWPSSSASRFYRRAVTPQPMPILLFIFCMTSCSACSSYTIMRTHHSPSPTHAISLTHTTRSACHTETHTMTLHISSLFLSFSLCMTHALRVFCYVSAHLTPSHTISHSHIHRLVLLTEYIYDHTISVLSLVLGGASGLGVRLYFVWW